MSDKQTDMDLRKAAQVKEAFANEFPSWSNWRVAARAYLKAGDSERMTTCITLSNMYPCTDEQRRLDEILA